MKKTILYLSITSLLTIPNAIATEVASLKEGEREVLKRDLAHMAQEVGKEKASKEAAQRLVETMKDEQREAKQLLHEVLEDLIPPYTPPMEESPLEKLQTPPTPPSSPLEKTKEVDLDEMETPKEETPKEETKTKVAVTVKRTVKTKEAEIRKENKSLQGMGAPSLSTHQQKLLFQRHLIGNTAWAALDGKNPNLSDKLVEAIQRHQGKTVEIYCLKKKSFKLAVSHKQQNYSYTF